MNILFTNVFRIFQKVEAFKLKLKFLQDEIEKRESCIFPTLNDFLNESHSKMNKTDFKKDIKVHLAVLIESFEKYYPKKLEKAKEDWIRDPFLARELPAHFDHREKEELIDMVTDTLLQDSFIKEELVDFWLRRRATHPLLSDRALKFIMPFVTSYLCEQGFSSMLYVKNKYTSQLKDLDNRFEI
jgi:zinc finger BED domain-containing protein 5/7/8/9